MAKVSYQEAFPEAADKVQTEVVELQAAEPCIPPCGFQIEARNYKCESCRITECPLPIDCPVQDIHKAEGDITVLNCDVKFSVPPERIIKWKFVRNIRSKDLSFFEDLYFGPDPSFLIRPTTGVHHGTYACEIVQGDDVLVRKYMYLNVTVQRLGKEKELQKMFQDILNPPPGAPVAEAEVEPSGFSLQDLLREPDSLRKKGVILFFVGLLLSSMLVTLLLVGLCYWATDVERA